MLGLKAWEGICAFCQRQLGSLIILCCCLHYRKDHVILYFGERLYLHEDLDQFKDDTFRNALSLPTDLANNFLTFFWSCWKFGLILSENQACW